METALRRKAVRPMSMLKNAHDGGNGRTRAAERRFCGGSRRGCVPDTPSTGREAQRALGLRISCRASGFVREDHPIFFLFQLCTLSQLFAIASVAADPEASFGHHCAPSQSFSKLFTEPESLDSGDCVSYKSEAPPGVRLLTFSALLTANAS